MYRKYYSYSDMPQLVKSSEPSKDIHNEPSSDCKCEEKCCSEQDGRFLGKFRHDDVILGIIILALLLDDSDDSLLLIALAVIFLTGVL